MELYINDKKLYFLPFNIEISSKYVEVVLNLAFLIDIKYNEPQIFF